jgi:protein-arginine kinase activator protein McsA
MGTFRTEHANVGPKQLAECPRCGWNYLALSLVWEQRTEKFVCLECYDKVHRYIDRSGELDEATLTIE